jgi:hypothetical protein
MLVLSEKIRRGYLIGILESELEDDLSFFACDMPNGLARVLSLGVRLLSTARPPEQRRPSLFAWKGARMSIMFYQQNRIYSLVCHEGLGEVLNGFVYNEEKMCTRWVSKFCTACKVDEVEMPCEAGDEVRDLLEGGV